MELCPCSAKVGGVAAIIGRVGNHRVREIPGDPIHGQDDVVDDAAKAPWEAAGRSGR